MQTIVYERVSDTAHLPRRGTAHAACWDVYADLSGRTITIYGGEAPATRTLRPGDLLGIAPGERALIPLGFKAQLPVGYEAQIRPRSGLALKQGLTVLNAPGTVDADYPGEWMVLLINHDTELVSIRHGDRIAQVGFHRVTDVRWVEGPVGATGDRVGGFGSTGR